MNAIFGDIKPPAAQHQKIGSILHDNNDDMMDVIFGKISLLETWVLETEESVAIPSLNVVCDGSATDTVHR